MMLMALALMMVQADEFNDPEPWKDEAVCAWKPGMKAIEMVPARTRKLWNKTLRYRVEGTVSVDGKDVPYTSVYKEAENMPWFAEKTAKFGGHTYEKYGFPRILEATDVVPVGEKDGVVVAAEPNAAKVPDVVYVSNNPLECEFQPYQLKE